MESALYNLGNVMDLMIAKMEVMRQKKPARRIVLLNTFVVPVDNALRNHGNVMEDPIAKMEVMRPLMVVDRTAAV